MPRRPDREQERGVERAVGLRPHRGVGHLGLQRGSVGLDLQSGESNRHQGDGGIARRGVEPGSGGRQVEFEQALQSASLQLQPQRARGHRRVRDACRSKYCHGKCQRAFHCNTLRRSISCALSPLPSGAALATGPR